MNRFVPSIDVLVAVPDRAGANAGRVGARVRLGQAEGDQPLARGEAREPAILLLRRSGDLDRDCPEGLDREDQARRGAVAADLLDGEAQREQVCAQTAVALLEGDREDVVVREQAADVLGPGGGPVDLGGAWGNPLVGEHADGIPQELLLLGQAHGAVAGLRGGHRGHPSSGMVSRIRSCGRQIVRDDIGASWV